MSVTSWPVIVAWDEGIPDVGFDEGEPDWSLDPLNVPFVRDQHLRAADGQEESTYIEHLIRVSLFQAERVTWRTILPKPLCKLRLEGRFPDGVIVVPRPPLISVESIDYVDGDGVTQTLEGGSPATFVVSAPSGPTAKRGRIAPLALESWPATRDQLDAVIVHLTAGYSGGVVPDDITHGRLMLIGEMYKQRSESVAGVSVTPAIVRALDLWKRYRAY